MNQSNKRGLSIAGWGTAGHDNRCRNFTGLDHITVVQPLHR